MCLLRSAKCDEIEIALRVLKNQSITVERVGHPVAFELVEVLHLGFVSSWATVIESITNYFNVSRLRLYHMIRSVQSFFSSSLFRPAELNKILISWLKETHQKASISVHPKLWEHDLDLTVRRQMNPKLQLTNVQACWLHNNSALSCEWISVVQYFLYEVFYNILQ